MRPVRLLGYFVLVAAGLACCATLALQLGIRPELRERHDVNLRKKEAPQRSAAATKPEANVVGEGAPAATEGPQHLLAVLTGVLAEARQLDCAELEHDLCEGVAALCAAGHRALARAAVEDWLKGENADHVGFSVLEAAALAGDSFADAARWLGQLPPSLFRDVALAQIVARWSVSAPRAALDAASTLPLEARLRVMPPIVTAWSERDAIAATEWIAAHEESGATDAIIARVLTGSTLAQRHPRAMARWLELIRDPTLRREVQASLAGTEVLRFRE